MPEALVGEGLLTIDRASGYCYGLNATGAIVWALLEQPIAVENICEKLTQRYDVDAATCEQQVLTLLGEMETAGLIE